MDLTLVSTFDGSPFGISSLICLGFTLNVQFLFSEIVQVSSYNLIQEALCVASFGLITLHLRVEMVLERDCELIFETVAPVRMFRKEFHCIVEGALEEVL